jgi:hypothetical protein
VSETQPCTVRLPHPKSPGLEPDANPAGAMEAAANCPSPHWDSNRIPPSTQGFAFGCTLGYHLATALRLLNAVIDRTLRTRQLCSSARQA